MSTLAEALGAHSDEAQAYLAHLTTLPLDALQAEPERLAHSSTQLDGDLSLLCFRSYPTFLLAHECTHSLMSSLSELETSLHSFIDASVALNQAAKSFESGVKPVLAARARIMDVQDDVDTVGQVLDLPRLVGHCVRSGQWNDAMEWSKRVHALEAQVESHPKGQAAMAAVRQGVDAEISALKARVLETLSERSLKLPGAVRAIQLLRKMNESPALQEAELQLILLTGRWECLRFQTEALQATFSFATDTPAADERSRFLKRWVEIWREVVGDAVNMYQEVFIAPSASTKATGTGPVAAPSHAHVKRARSTLTLFLHQALKQLVDVLKQHLPHIPPVSSLSSLLTQLTYCSAAFSRFGFEFKSVVEELIVDRVQSVVLDRLAQGATSLHAELNPKRPASIQHTLLAPESLPKVLALPPPQEPTGISHQPPHQLTLFPPLARYVNAVASALNELRLLPFPSLFATLQTGLLESLESATASLLAVVEAVKPTALPPADEEPDDRTARERDEGDRRAAARMVLLYWARGVVPWSDQALRLGVYEGKGEEEPERVKSLKQRVEAAIAVLAPLEAGALVCLAEANGLMLGSAV